MAIFHKISYIFQFILNRIKDMRRLLHFIFAVTFISHTLLAKEELPYTTIENKAKVPILTPEFSQQQILKIRLQNGLEAYLVSDPKSDKSGALMSVRAGSWEDPKEYPGLAHFLEHMLFLGTKKYPEESGYSRYISEHGGLANAFTTNTFTNYLFEINNPDFPQVLDRFADFFVEPLFTPSGVSRELNAIDQEYAKNLENDDWRMHFIDKELANPQHPFHNFNIGNTSTLSKVSRETLIDWYKNHYSANLMRLVVVSSLPMDQLLKLVVEDFSKIPNSNKVPFSIDTPALRENMQGKMVYVEPLKDTRSLAVLWELPPEIAQMKESQPVSLVCHVLGHEGEESLLAQLKREHLAENLQCGKYRLGDKNNEFFLEIQLTDKGIENVETVIYRVFQAIANLKEKGIPQRIFDELQKVSTTNYQYQPREELFSGLMKHAEWLTDEDLSTYPEQSIIIQKYDPENVKFVLNVLTPSQAHYYFIAPSALTHVQSEFQEKWMGTSYSIKDIDPKQIQKWENATSVKSIDLPAENPFIPQNLQLIESQAQSEERLIPQPEMIINDSFGKVYFALDTRYQVPKTSVRFEILTPNIDMGNPGQVVIADLLAKTITNALSKVSYPASIAGLKYSVKRENFGIGIVVEGYSEHLDILLTEIVNQIKEINPTEEEFNIYKESLRRDYQNFEKKSPLQQGLETLRTVIYKKYANEKQKAHSIEKVTFSKFQESVSKLFSQNFVEGIIYGNIQRSEALALSEKFISAFKAKPYLKAKHKKREVINLPNETGPYYFELPIQMQGNALVLAIQDTPFDFKNWAGQQVLMQALKEPFYSELRTKQQTGYLVFSEGIEVATHLFNLFAIQSNTHSPRDLLARSELFNETFLQEIAEEVPKERFEIIKNSLIAILEQPPKDISEMTELLQNLAFERNGDFDWVSKRINGLKELTYEEFLKKAHESLGKINKKRVGLLIQGQIPKEYNFNYAPLKNLNSLRCLSTYSSEEDLQSK